MSALPLQTFNTPDHPIFFPLWLSTVSIQNVRGDIATFSTINGQVVQGTISSATAYIGYADIQSVSSSYIYSEQIDVSTITAEQILTSTISANTVVIDGNTLTTDRIVGGTAELLLNGVPIATTANLSSIQDWSLFPAVSDVDMNNNSITNGAAANFTTLAGVVMGSITSLSSSNITNSNSIATNTLQTTGSATVGTVLNFRNLNQTGTVPYTNTFTTLTDFKSSVAGTSFTASNSLIAPLLSNTGDMTVRSQRNLALYGCNAITADSLGTTIITNNAGTNVSLNSLIRLNAKNGNRGRIELTADPGYAYIQGEVALTANAGTNTIAGIAFGGRITLNAGSAGIPSGFNTFYPSYVIQTGDSILSYAGGLTPITGVYGYNYVQGFNGVNIVAGTVSVIPNVPGTVYLYGTNAAGSGNSGGVRIQNGLSVDTIFPFPTGFVSPPYDLTLRGNAAGNMVSLSNVRDIYGGNTSNQGNIYSMSNINCYNLNTTNINGSPYGGGGTVPEDLVVSSITTNLGGISSLTVSSINGLPPGGGGGWVGTATSDLNMNGYNISSVQALNINSGSQVRIGTPLAYVRAGYTSGTATSSISIYAASGIVGSADSNITFNNTKQLTLGGSNLDIAANNTLELYTANQGLSIYSLNGGVSTFAPNVSVVGSNSVGISGGSISSIASSNFAVIAPRIDIGGTTFYTNLGGSASFLTGSDFNVVASGAVNLAASNTTAINSLGNITLSNTGAYGSANIRFNSANNADITASNTVQILAVNNSITLDSGSALVGSAGTTASLSANARAQDLTLDAPDCFLRNNNGNISLLASGNIYARATNSLIIDSTSNTSINCSSNVLITSSNGTVAVNTPNGLVLTSQTFKRALGTASLGQPVFQQGATSGTGNNGSVSVTIPSGYTTIGSYSAFVSHQGTSPANTSVFRTTSNSFTIYWTNAGAGLQEFDWMTAGN